MSRVETTGSMDEKQVLDILQFSKIGIWRIETEEGKTPRFYADAVMDELLGITGPVTPQERFLFHRGQIHPEDLQLFLDYASMLSETRTEIVYRYIHPVSGEMLVRCSGARDLSRTDCVCIIGTHQNISDTARLEKDKQAERRLAEQNRSLRREQVQQESFYRELLDLQSCGLLAYTLPGRRILHMNAEALRMYGVKSEEEMQENMATILSRIYYPDPETGLQLRSLREKDSSVDYECVLNHGRANECRIMARTKTIPMPEGERVAVTTFLDVSDMVMLQEALQKAEEGSEAKSAFLFAMSHDLRTPMNAIIGYADLMAEHWDERELARTYLGKLKNAGTFLLGLIGNVLEVSRIESGKESLHEAPWNLSHLQEDVDVLLEEELRKKKLTVTKKVELPWPNVLCDETKLREILMNFMSNAVKYTPEGGKIQYTIEEKLLSDQSGVGLKISVADTGIGIAREYLPHLFEAFSRERNSSESGIMGTGLGLRIAKSFVDLMDGSISVDSTPGKGSCFTAEIPLRLTEKEEKKPLFDTNEKPDPSLEGRRILLAEDNALNAEITSTILEDAGMKVSTAGDGAAAISLLQNAEEGFFDLILMDIQMPHMNGYQAARVIRALPDARAKVPIVAMTANAFEEDRQEAFAAGMDDYVTKPVDRKKLLHTMAEVLKKK